MSDINLLPVDGREKELKELRKKMEEKSTTVVELSNLAEKSHSVNEQKGVVLSSSWREKLKKWWSGRKSDKAASAVKTEPSVINKSVTEALPKDKEIKEASPKKVFFQPPMADINGEQNKKFENKVVNNDIAPITKPVINEKNEILITTKNNFNQGNNLVDKLGKNALNYQKVDINLMPEHLESNLPGKKNVLIIFLSLIICLVLVVGVYFSLTYLIAEHKNNLEELDGSLKAADGKILLLKDQTSQANDFIDLLKAVRQVLTKHGLLTPVFDFLQKNTLRDVYYGRAQIDIENQSLNLTVWAKDYATASKQLFVFQAQTRVIDKIQVSNMELREVDRGEKEKKEPPIELVTFNLVLKIKPEFFYPFP